MRQRCIGCPDVETTHVVNLVGMLGHERLEVGIVDADFVLLAGHRTLIGKDIAVGHNGYDILVGMVERRIGIEEDYPH